MGLFHLNYDCHPGALVMRKRDGAVYRVRGNVSLWDTTAILLPIDAVVEDDNVHLENVGLVMVKPAQFKRDFLVLDAGVDELANLLSGLRQLPK